MTKTHKAGQRELGGGARREEREEEGRCREEGVESKLQSGA